MLFFEHCTLQAVLNPELWNFQTIKQSNIQTCFMQELINRLMAEGLTEQQAYKAVEIVKTYAAEKFPLFSGAINKVFDKYAPKQDDDFLH